MATVDQFLDYAQLLWNDYVLDMNAQQQRAAVLSDEDRSDDPFGQSPLLQQLRELLRVWLQLPQEFLADWRRAGWWNWRGGVVAAVVTACVYLLHSMIQWIRARWSARRSKRKQNRRVMQTVEFYRRLEQLLAKIGCERRASQTQREFAIEAGQSLAGAAPAANERNLPARIVEYFYRVRFGQQQLAPAELREVEEFLRSVDDVVTQREGNT
jgi:hypothetical protein